MRPTNPLTDLPISDLLESLLPDFVLAFAFFTALIYAILAKRFEHQRSAIAMSAALGMALSVGLVWWEQRMGLSIRDLGPFAVGLAMILLAAVMYQAIRQVGGSWAGIGIALGASLLVSRVLGMDWPLDAQALQTITAVALIVGIMAFFLHSMRRAPGYAPIKALKQPAVKHDMRDLKQSHVLSDLLGRRLRGIRREADILNQRPELSGDVVYQIKRTLPAEGTLTECMAQLRKKAHQIRHGHVARLKETRAVFTKLPASAKKKAAADLTAGYEAVVGIDKRLERLDRSVAANEKRIRTITEHAEKCAREYDYRKLVNLLEAAEKLQRHNSKLFAIIDRTEAKLTAVAERVAGDVQEVNRA